MSTYFLDTSTVVKRYAQETGTAWVQALAAPAAGHSLFVVRLTLAETVVAITRQERGRIMSAQAAATALANFQHDFARQYTPHPWPERTAFEATTLSSSPPPLKSIPRPDR